MNKLSHMKQRHLRDLLDRGMSVRAAAQMVGCDKNTAHRYQQMSGMGSADYWIRVWHRANETSKTVLRRVFAERMRLRRLNQATDRLDKFLSYWRTLETIYPVSRRVEKLTADMPSVENYS